MRLALVGFLILVLSSCASSPDDKIIGEWQSTSRPWTIKCTKDGQISMQTIGPPKTGTYRLDSLGNLKAEMSDGSRIQVKVLISNNELTLTDPDGTTSKFKRVQ